MLKIKQLLLPMLILSSVFLFNVSAASLTLTHIGALATNGMAYADWWYTGTNPTLRGAAGNGASVEVSIDGTETTVTADGSGNWSMATTMATGDYDISITSGSESYSFTLHTGQTVPAAGGGTTQTTQSTTAVPDTGSHQLPMIIMSLGLLTLAAYYIKYGRLSALKAFENDAVK